MKTAQKVSVIIPLYNHAPYLEETIDSVVASSHPNIEIIIINDGSMDNSEEVAL
jgi:glycosyltransferase involved in cell wall biosynthesis